MSRYLLDTGIASDLINRRNGVEQKAREAMERGDRIGIGTPVLGELVGGIEHRTIHRVSASYCSMACAASQSGRSIRQPRGSTAEPTQNCAASVDRCNRLTLKSLQSL